MGKAKVYFTRDITPDNVVRLYGMLGVELPGKVAVKVHSGEEGNRNYLHPEFMRPMVEAGDGTIVECNTAYEGARDTTEKHERLMAAHGWTDCFAVDIMDAEGPDLVLPIENGRVLKENRVGKNLANYASMLVLSHFKGHPMGGFGGALKNVAIGMASSRGKAWIHTAGTCADVPVDWANVPPQDDFLESMAEACESVFDKAGDNILFISVANNLSVDCDCVAEPEPIRMGDIGILASLDPVALDRACVDMVYNSPDPGKTHLIERMESRNATHILDYAEQLGLGTQRYELRTIDPADA